MATRVMMLAGGTGGHVYPALAVAKELQARGCEVRWMGTRAGLEARVVPESGIEIDWLAVSGFRGKGWAGKFKAPFKLIVALVQSALHLMRFRPNLVIGMGGFVAGPGGLMARMLAMPLVVHEQNRIPGTTNRFLVRFAKTVLEAFPGSFPAGAKAVAVGNPLRRQILDVSSTRARQPQDRLKVLVLGGSQGARALNQAVPEAIGKQPDRFIVRHQTGEAMKAETERLYKELSVHSEVKSFIEDMKAAYEWADLAICRSGAMTVSELAAAGLPSILVPFPFAIDDHQTANARYLADGGAAVLMPQTELNPDSLFNVLRELLEDPGRVTHMSQAARSLAHLDATERVCDLALAEARS